MTELSDRISVDPEQCGGRPCIRGLRIRVSDVLDLLAAGLSTDEVLTELTDLDREDVSAALEFASRRVGHPIHLALDLPDDLAGLQLPPGVNDRLQELLDRQDRGDALSPEQRREAEGLVALSELLSVLRLRAQKG